MPKQRKVSQPPKKRPRINADRGNINNGTANVSAIPPEAQRATLTNLPFELLAEILLYTCSPPTVLAVSRTCSYLNRSLAHNPAASFIWRTVRKTCKPVPLPDPGNAWKGSEAQYFAFVFDGGRCEICHKNTHAMYVSFATRIRLCGSYYCMKKFQTECLVDVTALFSGPNRQSLWVPYVEGDRSFLSHPPAIRVTWPSNNALLLRKTVWERFKRDLMIYAAAEQPKVPTAERTATVATLGVAEARNDPTPQGEEGDSIASIVGRCHAGIERFPEIMGLSVKLLEWRIAYDLAHQNMKRINAACSQVLASEEGWDCQDLFMTDAFSSLLRRKSFLLEKIEMHEVTAIRPEIESQLLERRARRDRQAAELTYKHKLTEVKRIYDHIRCGTLKGLKTGTSESTGFGNRMILPPLHVFCELPSIRTFKGRPDPDISLPNGSVTVSSNLESSTLDVADRYPDGWQSASKRKLRPLERVTAKFLCRRCRDGGVPGRYQREGCLDFRGVCSHACTSTKRKITENERQEAPQPEEGANEPTDGEAEQAPVAEETKKHSKERTYDWKVEVFEKDEKAVRLINNVLQSLGLSEDDSDTASILNKLGGRIWCKSCTGQITMDFDTAIGHAHRHENMEIQVLQTSQAPTGITLPEGSTMYPWHAFQRGVVENILGHAYSAKKLRSKVNYGCKHCPAARVRAMDFNALRSHAKAKHGIQDVRDEDIFTYSPDP